MKTGNLFAASLAVILLAGCAKKEAPAQPLRTVRVMKVDGAAASGSLTFPGEVRARYESRLGFRLGGKIVERRVDVGAAVKRGQVLARLDAQDASLNAAQAEAARALAEAEAKRYRDLRAKNFVSQAVLDAKETALKTAAAQAGVARNQAGYTALGRGAVVIDTTQTFDDAGHPLAYLAQAEIVALGAAEAGRMVASYEPAWQLVALLLKSDNRVSTYRLGLPS